MSRKLIHRLAAFALALLAGVLVYSMSEAGTGGASPVSRAVGVGLLVLLILVMGAAGRRRSRRKGGRDG